MASIIRTKLLPFVYQTTQRNFNSTNNLKICKRIIPSCAPSFNCTAHRMFSTTNALRNEDDDDEAPKKKEKVVVDELDGKRLVVRGRVPKIYSWEVSTKYLQSLAYKEVYGTEPVWVPYKRNFKGQFAPRTRKTCIKHGVISRGSPCPICRDDFLVVDYRNIELIKQFISPYTGKILTPKVTQLCQRAHMFMVIAIEKAWDAGLLVYDVKVRNYRYADYYSPELLDPEYRVVRQTQEVPPAAT